MLLSKPIASANELPLVLEQALKHGVDNGLCSAGKEVVVLSSSSVMSASE